MQSCTGRHRGPARGPDPGPGRRLGVSTRPNPVSFWSTLIFNASGVKGVLDVGLLSAIAPLVGILAMLVVGWDSDRTLARRCHAACVEFVAVRPPWRCPYTIGQLYLAVALISVTTAAHCCRLTLFWSVPSVYPSDRAKAGGIAAVTAMGPWPRR